MATTGIREQQLSLLTTDGNENIQFKRYDKDGIFIENTTVDVLITAPTIAKPINEDLFIEYIRPVRDGVKKVKLTDLLLLNSNPSFRYGTFGWTLGTDSAAAGTPAFGQIYQPNQLLGISPISGLYTLNQQFLTVGVNTTDWLIKSELIPLEAGKDINVAFQYFLSNPFSLLKGVFVDTAPAKFNVAIGIDTDGDGTIEQFYDFDQNKFVAGSFTSNKPTYSDSQYFQTNESTNYNNWNKYSLNITQTNFASYTKLLVLLYPFQGVGQGKTVFVDAFTIAQKEKNKNLTKTSSAYDFTNLGTLLGFEQLLEDINYKYLSGSYTQPTTYSTGEVDERHINYIPFDFTRKNRSERKKIDEIVLQEIMNDYRVPIKRYEGTFYRNDASNLPFYFFNKIWVNYGSSILQDPVSAMIDKMEYDVKRNEYKIVMHLPNQDTDVLLTFLTRFD
jgi:hypothetical protein